MSQEIHHQKSNYLLDKLIKLTTLIGTFLIFNGVLYSIVYYDSFGVKVFSYLQFTEILTLFIDKIFSILIFFGFFLLNIIISIATVIILEKKIGAETIEKQPLEKITYWKVIISAIIGILIITLINYGIVTLNNYLVYWLSYVLITIIILIGAFLGQKISDSLSETKAISFAVIFILVIPFIIYNYAIAKSDAYDRLRHPKAVALIYNDNDCKIGCYSGKTSEYIFLYDYKSGSSSSVSLNDVKEIYFHTKK